MESYKTPIDYINYLVDNQINVNIIDFVKELNKLKFKIDISFIDEFIVLVSKDDCCIHHNMLVKYGVITLNSGSTDVKNLIKRNNFINDEDYLIRTSSDQLSSGTKYKNEYYLHPRAFKKCLMRSRNTNIYADYYLLLEECIKYFNDYQMELNKKYIIKLKSKILKKENKICSLEEKLDTIIRNNEQLLKSNEETKIINEQLLKSNAETSNEVKLLLKINKRLDKKSNIMGDKLEEVHEDLKDTLNIKIKDFYI